MATLYYTNSVDSAWDTLLNWWSDQAFTIPSLALPADGDDVYLSGSMGNGPFVSVTLNHIYVNSGANVYFTGALGNTTSNGGTVNGTITGDAVFNGGDNLATITGNAVFNDSSNNGTVSGNAIFNGGSYNALTVSGSAEFNGTSYNASTTTYIGSGATFNDATHNDGGDFSNPLAGATFNDTSYNSGSGYVYSPTFNGDSYNAGTCAAGFGGAISTFNENSYNTGSVNGLAIFNGPYIPSRVGGTYNGSVELNMTCPACPPSGGSDQTIARLLNLPWFINL